MSVGSSEFGSLAVILNETKVSDLILNISSLESRIIVSPEQKCLT